MTKKDGKSTIKFSLPTGHPDEIHPETVHTLSEKEIEDRIKRMSDGFHRDVEEHHGNAL